MKFLYFIGLIPPDPLRTEITNLKIKISDEYKTIRALRSPPHITLIPPFSTEQVHAELLRYFCGNLNSFDIVINGFGAFKPRVMYLKVEDNNQLKTMHKQLSILMNVYSESRKFRPHMTLAFRDLTPEMFHNAWDKYKSKAFDASFNVSSLFLLRHNLREWQIFQEFPFANAKLPI